MRRSINAKDHMIDDVALFSLLFFSIFCLPPCIVKRGSCCLLIVKLGICIPYGDLTTRLVSMVFPLWSSFHVWDSRFLLSFSRSNF